MKIILILLFIHLSLFATGSSESNTNDNEVAKSPQHQQQEPAFVKVSKVAEQAVKVMTELKSIHEDIEKEKDNNRDMHEAI